MKPKPIFGMNNTSVIVEVHNGEQSAKILVLENVCHTPCKATPYERFNYTTGLIYVNYFDIEDLEEFKEGLQDYNVDNVKRVDFIKPKNPEAHAFLITFRQECVSHSIYIPGERQDTKVYSFNDKPMICYKCQGYGHTSKRCKSNAVICRRCSAMGHYAYECKSSDFKCFHCGELHAAGNFKCSREINERRTLDIRFKEKVSMRRAFLTLNL